MWARDHIPQCCKLCLSDLAKSSKAKDNHKEREAKGQASIFLMGLRDIVISRVAYGECYLQ